MPRANKERSKPPQNPPEPPRIYFLHQSAAWDWSGFPVFAKRWPKHKENNLHAHSYYEVVLVEKGEADHITLAGSRKLRAGDLIIIRPGMWHHYKNPWNLQIVNCLIDRTVLRKQRDFLHLIPGGFELLLKPILRPRTVAPAILHLTLTEREEVTTTLNAIIREREEKAGGWQGALVVQMVSLLMLICRSAQKESNAVTTVDRHSPVYEIINYLEENFRENITLSDLSKKFHISESYLSRSFSRKVGVSLINHLHHLRIEKACCLLLSTDWTISRIAGEVGYDEFTYFSRRFRREVGMTPRDYRRSREGTIEG